MGLCCRYSRGQESQTNPASAKAPSAVERGIELAGKRRCDDALPLLKESAPQVVDKQLKYRALMATARCGIRKQDGKVTVDALMELRHNYPQDPEVLYLSTQVFLKIAVHASRELADVAPNSYQVLELQAESAESEKQWERAAGFYREILERYPKLPEIHLRLGRALLTNSQSLETNREALKEFEQELGIDPTSADAEFWIGEVARLEGRLDDAVRHLTSSLNLEPDFSASLLTLGITYNSLGRFADAISPLERYTKANPEDPAGHFHLGRAYTKLDRKEDSEREFAIQREVLEKHSPRKPSPADIEQH